MQNSANNILIAIPCYGGAVNHKTMKSLIELDRLLYIKQIEHEIVTIASESLVTRARNRFANMAAFDTDSGGRKYTHLLFVDSDSVFDARDVLTILAADKPIVALPFALKEIMWEQVARAAESRTPGTLLEHFVGNPNINAAAPVSVNGISRIDQIGTGLMLINADVLRALAEAHPEWRYRLFDRELAADADTPGQTHAYDFFQVGVDPDTGLYIPEDFFFVKAARDLGFETFFLPSAITGHIGAFEYRMNLPFLAAAGMNARNIELVPRNSE